MSGFNQAAWAYVLYIKINNIQCQRLIEKFHIPQRGALVSVQDVDLLVEETPGGRDMLFLQHPWLRHVPVLVNSRTNSKHFGFGDVTKELTLYHSYLDNYHAALSERKKLPGGFGLPGHAPAHQPHQPPTRIVRPPHAQQRDNPAALEPKSEHKQAADAPAELPPANATKQKDVLVKPKPFVFEKAFVVSGAPNQAADGGPRLSELVKQQDPGVHMPPEETAENVQYVDEQGNPLSPDEVAQMMGDGMQGGATEEPEASDVLQSPQTQAPPQIQPPPPRQQVPQTTATTTTPWIPTKGLPPKKTPRSLGSAFSSM